MNKHTFDLKFKGVINVILGDSATGKTTIVNDFKLVRNTFETDATEVITELSKLFIQNSLPNTMLLLDLDEFGNFALLDDLVRSNRDGMCIVLLGRVNLRRFNIDCEDVYELITSNDITKNIPCVVDNDYMIY